MRSMMEIIKMPKPGGERPDPMAAYYREQQLANVEEARAVKAERAKMEEERKKQEEEAKQAELQARIAEAQVRGAQAGRARAEMESDEQRLRKEALYESTKEHLITLGFSDEDAEAAARRAAGMGSAAAATTYLTAQNQNQNPLARIAETIARNAEEDLAGYLSQRRGLPAPAVGAPPGAANPNEIMAQVTAEIFRDMLEDLREERRERRARLDAARNGPAQPQTREPNAFERFGQQAQEIIAMRAVKKLEEGLTETFGPTPEHMQSPITIPGVGTISLPPQYAMEVYRENLRHQREMAAVNGQVEANKEKAKHLGEITKLVREFPEMIGKGLGSMVTTQNGGAPAVQAPQAQQEGPVQVICANEACGKPGLLANPRGPAEQILACTFCGTTQKVTMTP